MREGFRDMAVAELLSVTGGVIAGSLLAFSIGHIELVPGLFVLLPGFLEMRGNISGSLSARLSAALFLKYTKPRIRKNFVLRENVLSSVILAVAVSFVLGIIAFLISLYVFGTFSPLVIYIAVFAGIISNFIEIPLTVLFTFWLFRHGHDPNNIMGPYVTTMGDIVSIASIIAALVILA